MVALVIAPAAGNDMKRAPIKAFRRQGDTIERKAGHMQGERILLLCSHHRDTCIVPNLAIHCTRLVRVLLLRRLTPFEARVNLGQIRT